MYDGEININNEKENYEDNKQINISFDENKIIKEDEKKINEHDDEKYNSNLDNEVLNKNTNNNNSPYKHNQESNIINKEIFNKISDFNENINKFDDEIINVQKDKNIFDESDKNNNINYENEMNNINLNLSDNKIDLENEINNDIFEKSENKNRLMQDEDNENINEAIEDKEYSSEKQEENNNKEILEKYDDEELKFNSHINNDDNINDENENELINYKNISDSEQVPNTNDNRNKEIEQEDKINPEMIQKLITKNNNDEILELYSFEQNENNIKSNENENEEYFINQNIVNLENKNQINNTNRIDNCENKRFKKDKEMNNHQDDENKINREKKEIGVIYDNRLKINNNRRENTNEEINSNSDNFDENKIENEINKKEYFENNKFLNGNNDIINANNKENDLNEDIANKKDKDNINQINPEKTKKLNFGIYKKNTQKIPFKKFQITTSKKSNNKMKLELQLENPKNDNKNQIFYEKYKTVNLQENNINNKLNKKKPFQINTNPEQKQNNTKNNIESYYKTAYIPYNNYIQFFNKTSNKNKNIKNNLSKVEEHKPILNNQPQKIKDYSFDGIVYQKRNIKNTDYSISSTSRVYSKKKKLNRRNTFGKYESNQNQNDFNENNNKNIKKEKININVNQIYSPNSYSKKIPISGHNKVKINNKNINTIAYNNENNDYNAMNNNYKNINIRRYSKNKNLLNSKANKYKMEMMYNTHNMELSNDDIYHNKYTPKININNLNHNTNYRQKEKKDFNYYRRNMDIYNTMKNFQINNRIKGNNQSFPYVQKNINIKNQFFNEEENYDENQYEDNNYENYYYNDNINKGVKIDIEDLIVLEERLNEIIYFLKSFKNVKNQCYDFWNFLFYSSLKKLEKVFTNKRATDIIKLSINLELLSMMLCYEFSFDEAIINKTYILLLEILEINHNSLILISEDILYQTYQDNPKNRWIQILNKIVSNYKNESQKYSQKSSPFYEKINSNNDKLLKKIKNILYYYQTEFSSLILSLSKKIYEKNYDQINDFFQEYILRKDSDLDKDPNINQARPPFILTKRKKKFTLILSLDETLIHLQQINYNQCSLKLRPYLIEFLENMKPYYELILFTSKTKEYSNPVLDIIQRNKRYFDFIFYREHCIFIDNNYVKDLTRIGRSLDSTIIVDNYPQNFKLQKENGINIKSFWAQNPNDRALYDLIPILINIAEDEIDVRDGLEKYKEDIVGKITSNIYNAQLRY